MPFNRKLIPSTSALLMFEAAARLGSFIRASEELCVSTAAVSKQIKSLENSLNVTLFNRSKQGVELTSEGQRYLATTLQALTLLENEAQSFAENPVTVLNVEVGLCFLHFWLLPRLDSFRQKYPEIQINLVVNNERSNSGSGGDDRCDVAFFYAARDSVDKEAYLLFPDRVLLVASPSFYQSRIGSRQLEVIFQQPKIMLREVLPFWQGWESISGQLGVAMDESDNILYVEDQVAVIQAAINDGGVALVNDWHVRELIGNGQLIALTPEVDYCQNGYFLALPEGEMNTAARQFIDWAKHQAS